MRLQQQSYRYLFIGLLLLLLLGSSLSANSNIQFQEDVSEIMITSLQKKPKNSYLRKLYMQLFFVPIWINKDSRSDSTQNFFNLIKEDELLGKNSKIYIEMVALEKETNTLYGMQSTLTQKVDLEFKISTLYKKYSEYFLYGSINWGAFQARLHNKLIDDIEASWVTYKPKINPTSLLENVAFGANILDMFKHASPKEYHYQELKKELFRYLEIERNGGWKKVPLKGIFRGGESNRLISSLRKRLIISSDYKCTTSNSSNVYDKCLKDAVKYFQARHGLVAKGTIGPNTMGAINVSIGNRIKQIKLNLDRIKWLPMRNEKRHVIINIPAFRLFFEEDKKLIQQMRVIVGKKKNPTPIFSNRVKTIVLNPHWNIPKSIIQKEIIPKLLKNSRYLKKKNIAIYSGWGRGAKEVNPSSVNWNKYKNSKTMPFRFAQLPGKKNALGKVKFLFPNRFAVYMHDTPNKGLFHSSVRAFSHGCIRLHKPRKLLETFSKFNDNIDFKKSQKILKGKDKGIFGLKHKVPVDVVYLTTYVDYDGILHFRNDIYGYDKAQLQSYRSW